MLVKVNSINDEDKVINVTKLDIDDYAVLYIQENIDVNADTIVTAETMTFDELNKEK